MRGGRGGGSPHREQQRVQGATAPALSLQYGPCPATKPQSPRLLREQRAQDRPSLQGVQGCSREHTGPWPSAQSRLEPSTLPPLPLARQVSRMGGARSGKSATTEARKM